MSRTTRDRMRLTHQQAHALFDRLAAITTDPEVHTVVQMLRYDWQRQEAELIQLGGIHGDLLARYERAMEQLDGFQTSETLVEPASDDAVTVEMYERMTHELKVMQAQIDAVQEAITTEVYHHG